MEAYRDHLLRSVIESALWKNRSLSREDKDKKTFVENVWDIRKILLA